MRKRRNKLLPGLTILAVLLAGLLTYQVFATPSGNFINVRGISANQYLLKQRNGTIINQRKPQKKIAIASLTKIMTALCMIEQTEDLNQLTTVPETIFLDIQQNNLAVAGLQPGEVISYRDLLHGILLPSGADATMTAVLSVSGNEEAFVAEMNRKAAELGMNNTHFTNSIGLDTEDHYSTVEDLALLLEYALTNETFYQTFTCLYYQGAATNCHPGGNYFTSSLISRGESLELTNGQIIGGKTGYTKKAGLCLASLAQINGEEYLLILAGSKGDSQSEQFNLIESRKLYNESLP
ncbi:D-alanyl-D-alanine carboxypeptidase [Enterococcus sp. 669A]|uniref:D-alanyl-D-alanine carboxypeptidase n=1 Tax=Candidatus Enterococcus moelleringii TaxID=2815325 RepID=A0ABS3LEA2_9ENTE|nr:D-alanyl-D-alanine carboxypeptidase [Enterococcus sp. 669A]MBO1307955.1 D-alanyl-D-alanine carboxypeptidase [Enterococcus sp. 669A]